MAIPKPVRQRMINVMYIVLLALLALQIPKEVTEAFLKLNTGIENSNIALGGLTTSNISAMEQKGINGDNLAIEFAKKARLINSSTEDISSYIEGIKNHIKDKVGVDEEGVIISPEETILTNEILIKGEENGINDGLAFELKDKIGSSLKDMLAHFPVEEMEEKKEGSFDNLVSSLPIYNLTYEQTNKDIWVLNTFDQMPAAGAIAMLSQIQSDIKSSENKLIAEIKSLINNSPTFDVFSSQIVAPSSYILKGEKFKADLFLSASSSQNENITIVANGRTYRPGSDGKVNFEEIANTVGNKTISGYINLKNTNTGEINKIPFKDFTYHVSEPYANVSPTMMNVFYIGLDNPINASAAGVLSEDLRVSVEGGQLIGSQSQYKVKVSQVGEATVTVKDSKGKTHGRFPFRVKKLPNPEAQVGKKPGGIFKPNRFRLEKALKAEMVNFDYEVEYEVLSYDMVYIPYNDDIAITSSNGSAFPPAMLRHVQRAKSRDRYAFENIKVKGPDGEIRDIQGINFRIIM